ncbi:MAG: bifunctional heptose 7-phosphate kinase/heptose 1-phosphate adenyltransferase [Bacteroidota bacterium]
MQQYHNLTGLFKAFSKKNILIIGDVMVDAYLWGKVDRISPEAPVPVVSFTHEEHRLGGAANVALNIKSLGANPIMCAVTGTDENARIFQKLTQNEGMVADGILQLDKRPTTVKTRVLSQYQQLLRVDREETHDLNTEEEKAFIDIITAVFNKHSIDAIIFQDYDKGALTPGIIRWVVEYANNSGIPTLVDPKKRHFFDYRGVTLFKPNFKELKEGLNLVELKKNDQPALFEAMERFRKGHEIQNVLLTLSELGVMASSEKEQVSIPAEVRDISDVSGAGDTVISMASLCMAAGLDLTELARLSNVAGGLVCEKIGVVPVQKDWIINDGYKLSSEA